MAENAFSLVAEYNLQAKERESSGDSSELAGPRPVAPVSLSHGHCGSGFSVMWLCRFVRVPLLGVVLKGKAPGTTCWRFPYFEPNLYREPQGIRERT